MSPPTHAPAPCSLRPRRYGAIVLAVEILGGLAMLPYGLCLTMRVTNNQVPPPDDKGQVRGRWAGLPGGACWGVRGAATAGQAGRGRAATGRELAGGHLAAALHVR